MIYSWVYIRTFHSMQSFVTSEMMHGKIWSYLTSSFAIWSASAQKVRGIIHKPFFFYYFNTWNGKKYPFTNILFSGIFFPMLHNPNVLVNRGDWLNKLWLLGVFFVGLPAHILSLCLPCPRFCVNQPFLQRKTKFFRCYKEKSIWINNLECRHLASIVRVRATTYVLLLMKVCYIFMLK